MLRVRCTYRLGKRTLSLQQDVVVYPRKKSRTARPHSDGGSFIILSSSLRVVRIYISHAHVCSVFVYDTYIIYAAFHSSSRFFSVSSLPAIVVLYAHAGYYYIYIIITLIITLITTAPSKLMEIAIFLVSSSHRERTLYSLTRYIKLLIYIINDYRSRHLRRVDQTTDFYAN